jgi:hypothetical protein
MYHDHERPSELEARRLTSVSYAEEEVVVRAWIAWVTCGEFHPLTVAFCELVFEPCT